MDNIDRVQVGVNRYGGAGAAAQVTLYNYNGCDELTLGQLVNAVCVRTGVALETQSVNKTNIITRNTRKLQALSEILEGVMNGTMNYNSKLTCTGFEGQTAKEVLTGTLGYTIDGTTSTGLPDSVDSAEDRLTFYARVKSKIDSLTSVSQKDMVDLQTYMSRRDVAYSTATNTVRTLGYTLQGVCSNFS